MLEYRLEYRGKKIPFKAPPIIKADIVFGKDPVWVNAEHADVLMGLNPLMFNKLGQRDLENPIEDAEDIKPKPELEEPEIPKIFECACGKEYKREASYKKHIEKCSVHKESLND